MYVAGQMAEYMSANRKNDVVRIFGDLGQKLRQFVRARVANDADAEDILQDVWHRLVATIEEGPVEKAGAWLYTVARNRIIDHYRAPQMASLDALADDAEPEDAAFELPDLLLRDDKSPESADLRNLFWEQLQTALAELPPEQRQVFVWHELEGMSFQEITALTGDNLNTLMSSKSYAVMHLRRRFQWLRDEFLQ